MIFSRQMPQQITQVNIQTGETSTQINLTLRRDKQVTYNLKGAVVKATGIQSLFQDNVYIPETTDVKTDQYAGEIEEVAAACMKAAAKATAKSAPSLNNQSVTPKTPKRVAVAIRDLTP